MLLSKLHDSTVTIQWRSKSSTTWSLDDLRLGLLGQVVGSWIVSCFLDAIQSQFGADMDGNHDAVFGEIVGIGGALAGDKVENGPGNGGQGKVTGILVLEGLFGGIDAERDGGAGAEPLYVLCQYILVCL